MTMPAALLDTDILSELFKGKNSTVARRGSEYLRQHGRFSFSAISRFEVLRGLRERGAVAQLARFGLFSRHSLTLAITDVILDRAADLWAVARRSGRTPGDADLIIACTAMEHGLTLVTGNQADFAWMQSLRLDSWR